VVPAGVKVRVLITSQDVIHSWWVPALAIKKDAIPGFINEAWFDIDADKTGTYRGQCSELCGRDHGFMPIVLDVKSKQDFDLWLKAQRDALAQPAAAPAAAAAPATAAAPAAVAAPAAPAAPTASTSEPAIHVARQ
jgi:cytochrome c oxidase subunit 2